MSEHFDPMYRFKRFVLTRIGNTEVLNLLDDVYHVVSLPFGYLSYLVHRALGRPYFGVWLASAQGNPARFPCMAKCVDYLWSRRRSGDTADMQVLEIGAYAGGSALVWAGALKRLGIAGARLVSVDPWEAYLDVAGNRHMHFRIMNRNLANGNVLRLFVRNLKAAEVQDICLQFRGRSADVLPMLRPERFDIIYIDANHHVDAISKDLEVALPLLKDGGLMCGPALEMQLEDLDPDFVKASFDKDFVADPASRTFFHPGVSYAVGTFFGRRVSSYGGFWVVRKKGPGFEDVVLD